MIPIGVLVAPASGSAATSGTGSTLGSRTLATGASGPDVSALQALLKRAGFEVSPDGTYSEATATLVSRFQRAARVPRTGRADAVTISRLRAATGSSGATATAASNGGFSSRAVVTKTVSKKKKKAHSLGDRIPLRKGMRGQDVRVLQDYLRRAGFTTKIDGDYGSATAKTVRLFEADQERTTDGNVDAADIDQLRSIVEDGPQPGDPAAAPLAAAPAALAPGEKAIVGPDGLAVAPASAPDVVKQIIAAGNEIASKPYRYGGGHGKWQDSGYDCSGSVSYALHGAGLLETALPSGSFTSWGEPGPGTWVTIYANGGHMYMVVAGLRFDTSGRREAGSRWQSSSRSSKGYTVVHPAGL